MAKLIIKPNHSKQFKIILFGCFIFCSLLLYSQSSSSLSGNNGLSFFSNLFLQQNSTTKPVSNSSCSGKYIYVHDLPGKFNQEIIKNCSLLIKWHESEMCQSLSNMGLGPKAMNSHGILQNKSWFVTNPYMLEVIFHNRMKNYNCLTNNSSIASAVYVPFYPGLDLGRFLWGFNSSMRDSTSIDLFNWLSKTPQWEKMLGRDHFLVLGRTTWDFRRLIDNDTEWGNKLLYLPETNNITVLAIESSPWIYKDFAIPYPTYFHPSSDEEVFQWQDKVRRQERPYLFSFVGAPRPTIQDSLRAEIINQCLNASEKCKWVDCGSGDKCNGPIHVMEVFQMSNFCLQPRGDTYTRRSTFDSILAGCIPVFFDTRTAYDQYIWHLPKNYSKYSVFISKNAIMNGTEDQIEKILSGISRDEVLAMREEVISLIPKVIYANPSSRLETLEDAFDFAIKGVLERVEAIRKDIKENKSTIF